MTLLKSMFFIELFMIILEGYFEYLITASMNWQHESDTVNKEGQILMVFILILCLGVAPIAFIYQIANHINMY